MKDSLRKFVAAVASRTPEESARLLGVPVEALLDAMAPSTETMADFLAACPTVSLTKALDAEAERRGVHVDALTSAERRDTYQREVLRVLGTKPATDLHFKLQIDTSAARAAIDGLDDYLKTADAKLNPLGSPSDPVSVARALLKRAVACEGPIERLALIGEARAWTALAR